MVKFLIDGQALDDLACKLQQLEVLFDVIPEEPTGSHIKVDLLCEIGRDISKRTSIDLENMRVGARVESATEIHHG
ncbi:hypothetical protein BLA9940_05942 [Burkholderia aenigmatica]|uniref:hypothetical protein n=1 Tax=Burkholderia cepacia complex TaxID=87882 RepID=UPI000F07DFF9|nr:MULTISPECIES: hypothetical protein [Burkholderia cepacia complex]AYQ37635.1 hypothetical protein CVS37_05550 [Burkholderia lata]VWC98143.1 hypothetical protein BLA9940_05942 [Burkholderia aenigmatica]